MSRFNMKNGYYVRNSEMKIDRIWKQKRDY
jgi:hypothetical protein